MDLGYSALLRQYITAGEADYGDCAEFQINCPACHEAIFKAGAYGSDRQYFSHYAASRSDVRQCELRVSALSHATVSAANMTGQGQTMAQFFGRFQDPVIQWLFGSTTPEWLGVSDAATMKKRIAWIVARPHFIHYAEYLREFSDPANWVAADANWEVLSHELQPFRSAFWVKRQCEFARDFLAHLHAPNSLSAWAFMLATAAHVAFPRGTRYRDTLLYSKNTKLRKTLSTMEKGPDKEFHTVNAMLCMEVLMLLALLPYFDVLKGTVEQQNRDVYFAWREAELRRAERQAAPTVDDLRVGRARDRFADQFFTGESGAHFAPKM